MTADGGREPEEKSPPEKCKDDAAAEGQGLPKTQAGWVGGAARSVIEQIWFRARINAFAHRAAGNESADKAETFFKNEMISALLSIFSVIVVFMASTYPKGDFNSFLIAAFTILSIIFTLFSLFYSVMANCLKLEVIAAEHRYQQNSFQYIAQRARQVKWPDMPEDEVVSLLKELERDFQLMKARGREPEDKHFDVAIQIHQKVHKNPDTKVAQSFDVTAK